MIDFTRDILSRKAVPVQNGSRVYMALGQQAKGVAKTIKGKANKTVKEAKKTVSKAAPTARKTVRCCWYTFLCLHIKMECGPSAPVKRLLKLADPALDGGARKKRDRRSGTVTPDLNSWAPSLQHTHHLT